MNIKLNLFKNLGATLIHEGQAFLRKAHNVQYTRTLTRQEVINSLKALGIEDVYCADARYRMTSIETMNSIIKHSWIDRAKYVNDFWDCDDYAFAFKSHLAEVYGINAVALARGTTITMADGKKVSHRHCIFLATHEGVLNAYVFEAQNDLFAKLKKDEAIKLGSWDYQLSFIDF